MKNYFDSYCIVASMIDEKSKFVRVWVLDNWYHEDYKDRYVHIDDIVLIGEKVEKILPNHIFGKVVTKTISKKIEEFSFYYE